jgi:hypothetical protein
MNPENDQSCPIGSSDQSFFSSSRQIGGFIPLRNSKLELFPTDIILIDTKTKLKFYSENLWKHGAVVIVAIRRPGCFLCRHLAAALAKCSDKIKARYY